MKFNIENFFKNETKDTRVPMVSVGHNEVFHNSRRIISDCEVL